MSNVLYFCCGSVSDRIDLQPLPQACGEYAESMISYNLRIMPKTKSMMSTVHTRRDVVESSGSLGRMYNQFLFNTQTRRRLSLRGNLPEGFHLFTRLGWTVRLHHPRSSGNGRTSFRLRTGQLKVTSRMFNPDYRYHRIGGLRPQF